MPVLWCPKHRITRPDFNTSMTTCPCIGQGAPSRKGLLCQQLKQEAATTSATKTSLARMRKSPGPLSLRLSQQTARSWCTLPRYFLSSCREELKRTNAERPRWRTSSRRLKRSGPSTVRTIKPRSASFGFLLQPLAVQSRYRLRKFAATRHYCKREVASESDQIEAPYRCCWDTARTILWQRHSSAAANQRQAKHNQKCR